MVKDVTCKSVTESIPAAIEGSDSTENLETPKQEYQVKETDESEEIDQEFDTATLNEVDLGTVVDAKEEKITCEIDDASLAEAEGSCDTAAKQENGSQSVYAMDDEMLQSLNLKNSSSSISD